ncbi:MAG: type II toxin-antitoxin system VapC family toxin [Desulfuromonadales bacterium]
MRKVYLDSCIAIYLVEEHPAYCGVIENALAQLDGIVCYSPLTELECLVLPLRMKHKELLDKYDTFFSLNLKLYMPDAVYREAARLRAEFGIKTPDALHLATARYHECTELWTNDDRLARVSDGMVVHVF